MVTGIYIIYNNINGKYYIGSTTQSFKKRFYTHKLNLNRGTHHSIKLQNAWNKYGEENFSFEVLEEYPKELCASMEQWWINMTQCYENNIGYNICSQVGSTLGYKYTEEQCNNISKALKGKFSGNKHPMWGKRRAPTTLGYKHTEESLEKMKQFQRSRVRTPQEIEHWEKLLETQKGENHPRYGIKLTGKDLDRVKNLRKGVPAATRIVVLVFDMDGNFIEEIESMTKAAELYNTQPIKISEICSGKRKSIGKKYTFKIKEN